jgi:hypothetical protein
MVRGLCLALSFLLACSETPAPPPDAAPPARLNGQVRIADKWVKVAPTVLHDPKMDLETRCLLFRDDAKAQGQDVPVCYDKAPRVVTSILVERDKTMNQAMQRLTGMAEATHFVIDQHGATYQVLDLAYAPRHGGGYRPGEVRVIACERKAEDALLAALKGLYPDAKVEVTEVAKVKGSEP